MNFVTTIKACCIILNLDVEGGRDIAGNDNKSHLIIIMEEGNRQLEICFMLESQSEMATIVDVSRMTIYAQGQAQQGLKRPVGSGQSQRACGEGALKAEVAVKAHPVRDVSDKRRQ